MTQAQVDVGRDGDMPDLSGQLDAFFDEDVVEYGGGADLDVNSAMMAQAQGQVAKMDNQDQDSDDDEKQLDISRQPYFYKTGDASVVKIGKGVHTRLFFHPGKHLYSEISSSKPMQVAPSNAELSFCCQKNPTSMSTGGNAMTRCLRTVRMIPTSTSTALTCRVYLRMSMMCVTKLSGLPGMRFQKATNVSMEPLWTRITLSTGQRPLHGGQRTSLSQSEATRMRVAVSWCDFC